MSEWKKIQKLREHSIAKNKNLEAIYITKENAEKLSEETQAFSVIKGMLLIGVMSFHAMPVWMVCINPKGNKRRKYIFETDAEFERNFEIVGDKS